MTRTAILLFLAAAAPAAGAAPAFQDLDALDRQVASLLGAGIGEPGGAAAAIDRRLRLAPCPAVTIEPPLAGAVTVRCAALGWRLRVALARPARASPAAYGGTMRAEPVVRRGDPVAMTVSTGTFTVSMNAIAEQDGAPGDRIRIRADSRSAPRMAEVVAAGQVQIPGFK